MKQHVQYVVDASMQRLAMKQLFFAVYFKRRWIGILVMVVLSGICYGLNDEVGWVPFAIFSSISMVLISLWVITYVKVHENAQSYLRTIQDPLHDFTMDEELLEVSNTNGMKRVMYAHIDRLVQTEDFYIPMVGKVPIICVPKSALNLGMLVRFQEIESRVESKKKAREQ